MGLVSLVGRVLFVSVFILSAFQEFNDFGSDGGPAARTLASKYRLFGKHVTTLTGLQLPRIEMKVALATFIAMKGLGSLLFIIGSSFGAYLILFYQLIATLLLCDFYNHEPHTKEFNNLFFKFTENLALFGAVLFFIGMKNSIPKRQLKKKAHRPKASSKEA